MASHDRQAALRGHMATARARAARAGQEASDWVEKLARFGYAAKGVVYIIVGVLAFQTAIGEGGRTTGSEGALQTVLQGPFGKIALGIIAVGLTGYVIWRWYSAFADPENAGTDAKGIGKRLYWFITGCIYGFLVYRAVAMLLGDSSGSGSGGSKGMTAQMMSETWGRVVIGIAGVAVVGAAIQQFVRAYRKSFMRELRLDGLAARGREWIERMGRIGLSARGVVFTIIGVFFVVAAWQADSQETRGLGGALDTLRDQAYGPWLLGVVAIGLVAYGAFQLVKSRYRRIAA